MSQDQGKPSDRLLEAEKHGVFNPVVKGLFDELHQRLVSAEAEIKDMREFHLIVKTIKGMSDNSMKSPTQEATKQWCECSDPLHPGEHRLPSSYKPKATKPECEHDKGDKWSCLDKYTYIIAYPKTGFPKCPICKPIPTHEPRKLTEILAKSYDEFDFSKMAEAAVKEVERVAKEINDVYGFMTTNDFEMFIKDTKGRLL